MKGIVHFLTALLLAATAQAQSSDGQIAGIVTEKSRGHALADATVVVTAGGVHRTVTTDRTGAYAVRVPVGTYGVLITYGTSTLERTVEVRPGTVSEVSGVLDARAGEVITIKERAPRPPEPPRPAHDYQRTVLPYSDEAIDSDTWHTAWLLLYVDEQGVVTGIKVIKHAGHALDEIAVREGFKIRFNPAVGADGYATASRVLWKMEWPAYWRSVILDGTALARVQSVNAGGKVPCADTGPKNLDSVDPQFRDCAPPDFSKAASEPLIVPAERANRRAPGTCDAAEPKGCYNLGVALEAKHDTDAAVRAYERACPSVPLACTNLGLLLADNSHAADLFRTACDAGELGGCNNLGLQYRNGDGVPEDPARARALFGKVCDGGDGVGCFNLSIMDDWGLGAPRDPARAAALRDKGCKLGYAKACKPREP